MIETVIWIGIYFGIAFVISRLLPFPYSLIVIVLVVIGLGFYRRRRSLRKTGQAASSGSSYFGNMFGSQGGIQYYCMSCGTKHNQTSCPNCGSKLKKAGFWWKRVVLAGHISERSLRNCIHRADINVWGTNTKISECVENIEKICEERVYGICTFPALILTFAIPAGRPLIKHTSRAGSEARYTASKRINFSIHS